MIPDIADAGELPPGEHSASWVEIESRFATNDTRRSQFEGLKAGARALAASGCTRLWLNGSYVTEKPEPGDFDATFNAEGIDWIALATAAPEMVQLDPPRAAQKQAFRGEFLVTVAGGIDFVEFFQTNRDSQPKGIIVIDLTMDQP